MENKAKQNFYLNLGEVLPQNIEVVVAFLNLAHSRWWGIQRIIVSQDRLDEKCLFMGYKLRNTIFIIKKSAGSYSSPYFFILLLIPVLIVSSTIVLLMSENIISHNITSSISFPSVAFKRIEER